MKAISHSRQRLRASCAGQAAPEFAMIATVLFLLTFAIMALGSAVFAYNTMSNAAREAVRYASVHSSSSAFPANDSDIEQVAVNYAQGLNLELSDVHVTWPSDPNQGMRSDVQVRISYTYNLKIPFMSAVALNLSSTSRMLVSQ